jgi:hypothetical protein
MKFKGGHGVVVPLPLPPDKARPSVDLRFKRARYACIKTYSSDCGRWDRCL